MGNKTFKNDKGEPESLLGRVGEVIAKVRGHEDVFVIEVDDDSYIVNGSNLVWMPPLPPKDDAYIAKKRRRGDPDVE
jgi:hypothetical protein